ncbi:MAG: thioredoxin family protein [Syntrophaceae bacterium]|nr:thioredoxin family protein [Syntrophaceae bacterium]
MAIDLSGDVFEAEVVQSPLPVLVDFWGPRCAPCLALIPQVENLEQKYESRFKITKVDASKNRRMCLNLKVLGLPTFLIYKEGKEVARLTGEALTIREIEAAMGMALEGK